MRTEQGMNEAFGSAYRGSNPCAGTEGNERRRQRRTENVPRDHAVTSRVEYPLWCAIIQRCENPNHPAYDNYGGRGVRVAPEFRGPSGFVRFLAHIGPRPSPRHSIDRIDNSKGYEKGNLRWADAKTQARNRRTNRMVTHDGVTRTLAEWAEHTGLLSCTIKSRLNKGWPVGAALETPAKRTKPRKTA